MNSTIFEKVYNAVNKLGKSYSSMVTSPSNQSIKYIENTLAITLEEPRMEFTKIDDKMNIVIIKHKSSDIYMCSGLIDNVYTIYAILGENSYEKELDDERLIKMTIELYSEIFNYIRPMYYPNSMDVQRMIMISPLVLSILSLYGSIQDNNNEVFCNNGIKINHEFIADVISIGLCESGIYNLYELGELNRLLYTHNIIIPSRRI